MENYCAFSKNHTCLKWLDYVITRQELGETNLSLSRKLDRDSTPEQYIQTLHEVLDANHLYPDAKLSLGRQSWSVAHRQFHHRVDAELLSAGLS